MVNVAFKKGLSTNLPEQFSAGSFYVTTDEGAMYLDLDASTRLRFSDFQPFANLTELQQNPNPQEKVLYYIEDLNCLARWNGTQYIQINVDTGATSIEVVGSGNAVTSASYDDTSRKITLTKGSTFATPSDLTNKIGAIDGTVKDYVDAKTEGIASDEALTQLTNRVTTAEGAIDDLEALVGSTSVSSQIDTKINALDLANTYETKGAAATAKSEIIGTAEDTSTVDTIKGAKKYADEKASAAQSAAISSANGYTDSAIAGLNISQYATTSDVSSAISDAKTELIGTSGDTATSNTIEGAKKYADSVVAAQISAAYKAAGSCVFSALPELNAENEGKVYNITDSFTTTADFVDGADKSYPAGTNVVCIEESEGVYKWDVLAGMVDLSAYDTAEVTAGKIATAKSEAISEAATDATSKANAAETAAKSYADTEIAGAKTELIGTGEGVTASTIKAGVIEAKNYADGLNSTMNGRVTTLESASHSHSNKALLDTYTQTEENLADAVTKKHSHTNASVLDGITSEKVSAWDAAEQNAKDYADSLVLTWGTF